MRIYVYYHATNQALLLELPYFWDNELVPMVA